MEYKSEEKMKKDFFVDPAIARKSGIINDALQMIEFGCEYLFVTGVPGDAHEVTNLLFSENGLVRSASCCIRWKSGSMIRSAVWRTCSACDSAIPFSMITLGS